MIAAMIDGVWLRAALSGWREADSESARALLTAFVDGRLKPARASDDGATPAAGRRFASINPATGEVLGYVAVDGPAENRCSGGCRGARLEAQWAATTGAERARVLRRAAELLRSRNQELAELETRDTGKTHPRNAGGGCRLRRRVLRSILRVWRKA